MVVCKEDRVHCQCIEMSQNQNWATENFKTNYTIQFPGDYEGFGMVGFEGNTFRKNRDDEMIVLSYSYCGPLYCDDFGDTLGVPTPNSIMAKDENGGNVILNSKNEFCLNGSTIGILYYNTEINSTGIFFIKINNSYLEGLTIFFTNTEYPEVQEILKTISKK